MKNFITIALAAVLSVSMIACMTACNNGGGQESSNTSNTQTSNPFAWGTSSTAQSENNTPSGDNTSSETPVPSTPDFSSTVSYETVSQTSTFSIAPSEPAVSDTSDLPVPSDVISDPDDSDWDDSDWDDSDWDDSDWDDSDWEPSKVTPRGGVMPEYVGTWTFQYDLSSMDIDPEYASMIQELMGDIEASITLDSAGKASMFIAQSGESSSISDGQWSAEGSTVYITFGGETLDFTVSGNKMTSSSFDGGYFEKT